MGCQCQSTLPTLVVSTDYVKMQMLKYAFVFGKENHLHEDGLQVWVTPRQNTHSTRCDMLRDHYMGPSPHGITGELLRKHTTCQSCRQFCLR